MIASVRGEVIDIALDHVVVEAAGVGYKVMATPATLSTLRRGAESRLITAMIVREDSMTLYGFPDGDARDLFLTLIGVSGIGPKIALAALAVYDATALRRVLADSDVTDFDERAGTPGLHTVHGAVKAQPRETVLPPDLFNRFVNDAFWRDPASIPPGLRVV
jgi:Holliday junction resolvasome RuvABC DNA-binding subunit